MLDALCIARRDVGMVAVRLAKPHGLEAVITLVEVGLEK